MRWMGVEIGKREMDFESSGDGTSLERKTEITLDLHVRSALLIVGMAIQM